MFVGGVGHRGTFAPPSAPDGTLRKSPEPTPVVFPSCAPQMEDPPSSAQATPLVALLQTIQRPADLQLSIFEALGVHVNSDVSPRDILPDASFLPPVDQWISALPEDLEAAIIASKKLLNNGNLSPGLKTYLERRNELSIDNTAAFRSIRRIPSPTGESAVRLGNAYEFFKNLELFSGYWIDTSLPSQASPPNNEVEKDATPPHLRTHVRSGTGTQLPPEYRQHLLTAFIKLVAYDFGCNVSFARVEPRLHLTPPKNSAPPSYFNSNSAFIYRTPSDRASARAGIVEGPLAAVSCRTTTGFATKADERLDLAREIIAVLLTAQQRARENKEERRFGEGKWWTSTPRWGGAPGGAIGREADKTPSPPSEIVLGGEKLNSASAAAATAMMKAPEKLGVDLKRVGGIHPSSTANRKKRGVGKDGTLAIYENYRKMLPPSSSWDRKARYEAIGKVRGVGYDDVFLVSALNHHVSLLRARVPERLLDVLGGEVENKDERDWGKMVVWRSRWYDLFLKNDRIEAMDLVWGIMSWLMRAVDESAADTKGEREEDGDAMDTS